MTRTHPAPGVGQAEEAAAARRPVPRRRRLLRTVAGAAVVLLALVGVAAVWYEHQVRSTAGAMVDVTVPPGAGTSRIAQILASDGVISHPSLFVLWARLHGVGPFRAGTFAARKHEGWSAAADDLMAAPISYRLTIPEGFGLAQIADRVGKIPGHSAAAFLKAASSGAVRSPFQPPGTTSLEGLLFPDTYQVTPGESDDDILSAMVARFVEVAHTAGLDTTTPLPDGVSAYQVITVASIIEREALVPSDRPLVAEVVYNRLHRGMLLQLDSTVVYALGGTISNPTTSDLQVDSPYNTYKVKGLPPTPIACPGEATLEAALHPATGDYLYYVTVQADGKEAFSTTYDGQLKNIALAKSRGLPG